MRLVDDNQVEMAHGIQFLVRVDVVDHRLIGGEDNAGIEVFLLVVVLVAQHASGGVRQQLRIVLVGLADEAGAVGQKQHILHPVVAHQHIDQRDGDPCLARSRGHHQQGFAMLLVVMLTHGFDGHLLIVAVGDAVFHGEVCDVLAASFLYQAFQVVGGMETEQGPRRIAQAVDDVGLEAVGVVDDRPDSILFLEAVGIEFGLVFAFERRGCGTLGFNHGQRESVAAKQHIVGIADAFFVRHSVHFDLDTGFEGLHRAFGFEHLPPCLAQHQVDEHLARLGLREVGGEHLHWRGIGDRLLVGSHNDGVVFLHLHLGGNHHGRLHRLGYQVLVKGLHLFHQLQFQEDGADHIIDIEQGEECLLARHIARVGAVVAHLADIVYGHHHLVVVDERAERFAVDQFEQRSLFLHLDVLEVIHGADDVFQRLACIYGAEVGTVPLVFLRRRAKAVEVVQPKVFYVVEIAHVIRSICPL